MSGELGKASLDLEANLEPFRKNMAEGRQSADDMERTLDALAAVSKIAEDALNQVKMGPTQAAESKTSAESIIEGVRGVSDEARTAARELDKVRITEAQAAESGVAGEAIKHNVKDIGDEADRTKRKLEEVKVAGLGGVGGVGAGGGLPLPPLMPSAIGAGALLAPAAGPAVVGLLGSIPVLAGSAAGAMGALALAFDGVLKAIGGNKKAFDDLGPAAQQFVLTVRSLDGTLDHLRQTAAANLFPGLTEGLKSALSPGTLNAVTQAIAEFARAIGDAGAAWGRYFGSAAFQSIFGPLMVEGAHAVSLLSDTFLHLFDAIGVVARAAIPFTDWLLTAIDRGAKLADSWLHAKDASGQLAGTMNEARTSLQLVAGLVESLGRVVFNLGTALYPISKVAVKDLTDGFNTLAGIIDRNKETIQAIVGGALSALVQVVKLAYGAVSTLISGFKDLLSPLQGIVNPANAVKDALEAIVALKLANALFTAATGTDALGKALLALKSNPAVWAVIIALGAVAAIKGLAGNADTWNGVIPPGSTPVDAITGQRKSLAQQVIADQKKGMTIGQIQDAFAKGGHNDIVTAQAFTDAKILKSGGGSSSAYYSENDLVKMLLNAGASKTVALNLAAISAHGEDPSGNPRALNNNPKTGDYSAGLFQENFYAGLGPSRVKEFAPMFGLNPNMPVKQFVSWLQGHPEAQAKIALAQYKSQGYSAWTTAAGLGITDATSGSSPFGTVPPWSTGLPKKPGITTGAGLLPDALRCRLIPLPKRPTVDTEATPAEAVIAR